MNKEPILSVRGVRDILPQDIAPWLYAQSAAERVSKSFGYSPIETPVLENAALIERGVGVESDIVAKELYKFRDGNKRDLILRPEGTAGTLRAYFEGGLKQQPSPSRLYMQGAMFRRDNPQSGRYRQFYQFSLEAIGAEAPALDAEVITIAMKWFQELKLTGITLQLNSIGDAECRPRYRQALIDFLTPLRSQLSPDSQRRLVTNPLRILDSKLDTDLLLSAPKITEYLCNDCQKAFSQVCQLLDISKVPYTLNPRIVRGLDYYNRTTFEFWVTSINSAQNALGGGGRYDGLAQSLGWPSTPAVGFACGLDRAVELLLAQKVPIPSLVASEVLVLGDAVDDELLTLAGSLCRQVCSVTVDYSKRSLSTKMKSANKAGFRFVVLLTPQSLRDQEAVLRDMNSGRQQAVSWAALPLELKNKFS